MSRIGQSPINFSDNVEVLIADNNVSVKGPKGELSLKVSDKITVDIKNKVINVLNNDTTKESSAIWGTTRALINNMVHGVTEGFSKNMEIVGVGYRAALKGKQLNLQLGFSHDINFDIPEGIKISVEKQTIVKISGFDKQQVGMVVSKIKLLRPTEPYKGKGIREQGQYVLRKEGKKK